MPALELDPDEISEQQLKKERLKSLAAIEKSRIENLKDAKDEAEILMKLQVEKFLCIGLFRRD